MHPKQANADHEALYQEILAAIRSYDLPAIEILAVLSNAVGKCIAMQDQTRYTADELLILVRNNIELGNKQMIERALGGPMGRA